MMSKKEYLKLMEEKLQNSKILLLCESGSKTYGFKDKNSDVDLRGFYVQYIDEYISLGRTKTIKEGDIGDIDYSLSDIRKFFGLLLKSNLNRIDWVFTPHKFKFEDEKLVKEIAKGCLTKKVGNHARGWAKQIYKMDRTIPKKCLYALRPLMEYINICQTEEVEPNIKKLIEKKSFKNYRKHINKLIKLKKNSKAVPEHLKVENEEIYHELEKKSVTAEENSNLPLSVPDKIKERANDYVSWRIMTNVNYH